MEIKFWVAGTLYIFIPLLFLPIHVRILFVFITNKDYRKLQCYQIMAQIEVLTFFMMPFNISIGLTILWKTPLISTTLIKLMIFSFVCIIAMDVVLALNRLKVIFALPYPTVIDTVLQVAVWISGLVFLGLMLTPMLGFELSEDFYAVSPDFSRPWALVEAQVESYFIISCAALSVLIYVVIVAYFGYLKIKHNNSDLKIPQKNILIQALVRFCGDILIQIANQWVANQDADSESVLIAVKIMDFMVMFNYICMPPILYLCTNRRPPSE
ncbi:hypothetical protein L596_006952 [Steinernema carpocapsae]|uniref:7TM GPCR serpentine receptor class x (Srx) domain-containing protein n=1 Tax=Steinernema carpocapsae TaxID=34508 RepID=A0A4U5P7L9_STECR|nr:hypothetical protein L596_006952 [Steinernema carpocapsae]